MSTDQSSDGNSVVKDAMPVNYKDLGSSVPKKFTSAATGELSNPSTNYTSENLPSTVTFPVEARRNQGRKRKNDQNNDTDGNYKKIRRTGKKNKPSKDNTDTEYFSIGSSSSTPREKCAMILSMYDCIRRRLNQIDEAENGTRNSHSMASTIMTDNKLKIEVQNPIGTIPGVEVGDIYYFRFEMILVGLHVQVMSGIDTITNNNDKERLAISVVYSGKYGNNMEDDDPNILYYNGQGGNNGKSDQKLEGGNLGMERSMHKSNPIRVIRGIPMKSINGASGKIYVYDGLYEIDEFWSSRNDEGFKCIKFKMVRKSGQPEVYGLWKKLDMWRRNPASRGNMVTIKDLSSGIERYPVCVVNEIDADKEPDSFTYMNRNLYAKSNPTEPIFGCDCTGTGTGFRSGSGICSFDKPNCNCLHQNDGVFPYSSTGILTFRKPLIYECTSSCQCSLKCPNRLTQTPAKLHFEVFKTENTGWGLRSWDPIRSGTFVCEYTGSIIELTDENKKDRYLFDTASEDISEFKWNNGVELFGEPAVEASKVKTTTDSLLISSLKFGNVSRFINHSCKPNLFWQLVQQDHGENGYPHIMFFAVQHIPPMTELTFDYGKMGRRKDKCFCGTDNCRGVFG